MLIEGYEKEFPLSSMLHKINLQKGLQGDEYLTYSEYKARKREELISKAGYMGYVYGTGLTDFTFMPSEANLQKEYESYLANYQRNYWRVQEQKLVLLGAKPYVEIKAKILREAGIDSDISSPYAQMRGLFSDLECASAKTVPSEAEIRKAYETYLSNYQYIQKQKQEIFGDIMSGLQETETEDYGHKVDYMQKLLHRVSIVHCPALLYLGDPFYLPSGSVKKQVAMSLKKTDQIFVVSVGVLRGGILFGEHQLNEMSPEAYTLVREGLSSLGQVLSKVMVGIRKADGGLHELFGSIYDIPREFVGKEIKEFKEGAPKFVKGLTAFFLGEGIARVTLKSAGAIGKGALKVTKQTKREVEIFVRTAANKFDKLAKTGTRTLEGLSKSRIAVTSEGMPFWKFADDATCKNPKLFSVIEDTKFKKSGLGEVKTKVGAAEKVSEIGIKTEISAGISELDIQKFGTIVEKIAKDPEFSTIASRWGKGRHGTNQLLEHTLGKMNEPGRLARIEEYAGLKPGMLTDVYSSDPVKVTKAMKNFDDLATSIKTKATETHTSVKGNKAMHWKGSVKGNPKNGLTYIEYAGKPQTIINMEYDDYIKLTKR